MGKAKLYYQACREEYADQEVLRRELSAKTLGILTFGITVFGVGAYLAESTIHLMNCVSWGLIIGMGLSLVYMGYASLAVLIPRDWVEPNVAPHMKECFHELSGKEFVKKYADNHVEAIKCNQSRLEKMGKMTKRLIRVASLHLFLFVVLRVYLFFLTTA